MIASISVALGMERVALIKLACIKRWAPMNLSTSGASAPGTTASRFESQARGSAQRPNSARRDGFRGWSESGQAYRSGRAVTSAVLFVLSLIQF